MNLPKGVGNRLISSSNVNPSSLNVSCLENRFPTSSLHSPNVSLTFNSSIQLSVIFVPAGSSSSSTSSISGPSGDVGRRFDFRPFSSTLALRRALFTKLITLTLGINLTLEGLFLCPELRPILSRDLPFLSSPCLLVRLLFLFLLGLLLKWLSSS